MPKARRMALIALTLSASSLLACSRPTPRETVADPSGELAQRLAVATEGAIFVQGLAASNGLAAYEGAWPTEDLPGADAPRARVPLDDSPARGATEPLATLVVFSDFECPFCARLEPALARLLREHPEEVRVVFRHNPLPFHSHAMQAAEAAMEARRQGGDGAFWAMHDRLFQHQSALGRADLEGHARAIGVDPAGVRIALDSALHRARVEQDVALARRLGVTGTPATFVNGRFLSGARPYEDFASVVREEMVLARHAMQNGVPRAHVYAAVLAAAREGAQPSARAEPSAPGPPRIEPPADAVYQVPVEGSPALGRRTALVTIVEVTDLECPFCARVQPVLAELRQRYGAELRLVLKHNPLPFHPHAVEAAMAVEEARAQRGEQALWRMKELLFENRERLERQHLEGYAEQLGLDLRRFRRALDEETHRPTIERDVALARRLGATGTPTFFVNGVKLVGAQPVERFVELVDRRLAEARERVRRGTPRRRLYAALVDDGIADVDAWRQGQRGQPRLPVPAGAPSLGPATADLTVQVLSDFECPFCNRVRPALERLRREYPSRVRIVWRNHPLPTHPHAQLAAEAALEVHAQAGHDAFWAYHELLFDNQAALARRDLERYAAQLGGVDLVRFRNALDDRRHRDAVEADLAAVRQAGLRTGTPTLLVGDEVIEGAQPYEVLRDAVERALDRPAQGGSPSGGT